MTLQQRADAFRTAYAKWPASWPWLVEERGAPVLYAVWVLGNDYRTRTAFYGAYPHGFLARLLALFPDVQRQRPLHDGVLHVFSGSLPAGPYTRLDVSPAREPDIVGSVYDVATLLAGYHWPLVIADPPYSKADAAIYGTPMVDRRRVLAALADITLPGGFLAWLDTCWPIHRKTQWRTAGRILVQRSTNHRARVLSLFERRAA